jgi:hypothetical protein
MERKDNIFNDQMFTDIESNTFDLSHEHKTTMRFGLLYPLLVEEALPGDEWKFSTTKLLRMMPLISPVMHRIKIYEHWFFVPNRILWNNWEKFITEAAPDIDPPRVSWFNTSNKPANVKVKATLGVYMGLPYASTPSNWQQVSALPLAAYATIWNEYYRDQNVTNEILVDLQDGLNTVPTDIQWAYEYSPLPKMYKKDYFTAALPTAQKGVPVQIPLSGSDTLKVQLDQNLTGYNKVFRFNRNGVPSDGNIIARTNVLNNELGVSSTTGGLVIDPNGQWFLDEANAATINSFRTALALQAFLEKDIQGGQRYTETIMSHFGVTPPDFRLQRPEYIGGSVQNIVISEVLSQTENIVGETYSPLGQMAGHGISIAQSEQDYYRCEEHGYIMCLVSVEPDLAYAQQGIHRSWQRFTRYDYAFPTFAHLGEQAILNKELVVNHTSPEGTFGYIPRYSEYKYKRSIVTSEFLDTLNYWHLAATLPTNVSLNQSFLEINDVTKDLTRIFAITPDQGGVIDDYLVTQVAFDLEVQRKLPRFAMPQLVG